MFSGEQNIDYWEYNNKSSTIKIQLLKAIKMESKTYFNNTVSTQAPFMTQRGMLLRIPLLSLSASLCAIELSMDRYLFYVIKILHHIKHFDQT